MFLKITISSELPAVRWTKNMALSKSCEKVETLRFRIVTAILTIKSNVHKNRCKMNKLTGHIRYISLT